MQSIEKGSVSPNTLIHHGEQYTYSCDSGYTLVGSAVVTCSGGTLSTLPTCRMCKFFLFQIEDHRSVKTCLHVKSIYQNTDVMFLVTVSGTTHGYSLNGDDLVMSCDYSGIIEPTSILWYHDGSTTALTVTTDILIVEGSYNNNLQRSTLTIKSPTSTNNGPYTCSVSVTGASTLNHVVSSSVRTARVSDGNSASVSQVTVTKSELVVTCVVEGKTVPSFIDWYKVNGNTLQSIAVQGEIKANMHKVYLILYLLLRI